MRIGDPRPLVPKPPDGEGAEKFERPPQEIPRAVEEQGEIVAERKLPRVLTAAGEEKEQELLDRLQGVLTAQEAATGLELERLEAEERSIGEELDGLSIFTQLGVKAADPWGQKLQVIVEKTYEFNYLRPAVEALLKSGEMTLGDVRSPKTTALLQEVLSRTPTITDPDVPLAFRDGFYRGRFALRFAVTPRGEVTIAADPKSEAAYALDVANNSIDSLKIDVFNGGLGTGDNPTLEELVAPTLAVVQNAFDHGAIPDSFGTVPRRLEGYTGRYSDLGPGGYIDVSIKIENGKAVLYTSLGHKKLGN